MTHIFAASSLVVTGNPDNQPSLDELKLVDGKSIAELIHATENQGKDDSRKSERKTLS